MTAASRAIGAAATVKSGPVANASVVVGDRSPQARCQPADSVACQWVWSPCHWCVSLAPKVPNPTLACIDCSFRELLTDMHKNQASVKTSRIAQLIYIRIASKYAIALPTLPTPLQPQSGIETKIELYGSQNHQDSIAKIT